MTSYEIKPSLRKILNKLSKKDKEIYEQILEKIEEIINSGNINHYKNLRKPLQYLKRVRIRKSFVLTFRYFESEDKVVFYHYDHHDRIYNKPQNLLND